MKRKNIVGLIDIVAIVAAVIFAGCVEEETPVPTSFTNCNNRCTKHYNYL